MKIEKGIVKYKDRSDIVCTYGTTDDGTKYYFLDENDEKKFTNGNRVVSSLLVEAIDPMVKASNIGVIDGNGVVVIPCVNRSIRTVDDNTILVEAAVPISQSVIDSVELRNDPLAATKLVSTPALIKDKINERMGSEGKYLFNDQFSEATVCDINGNNLIDNEYYSFIAQANGKLYMSKNVADSDVKELALTTDSLDLGSVSVSQDVVEEALGNDGLAEKNGVPVDTLASNDEVVAPVDAMPANDAVTAPVDAMPANDAVTAPVDVMPANDAVTAPVDAMPANDEVVAPVDAMPANDEVTAPIDVLASSEDNVIPYNDDLSTVVDEKLSDANDTAFDARATQDAIDGSNMLQDKTPDFLTAEDMVSSSSDIPPIVEDSEVNEDSLGVNIGAEAGFDVVPTDMDVVAPYNDGLPSPVNDNQGEIVQDVGPIAVDTVADEKNEDSLVVAEEAKVDAAPVPEEVVDSADVKNETASETPIDTMPVSVDESVVAPKAVEDTVKNNDANANTIDPIAILGSNDSQAISSSVSDNVVSEEKDNSVKVENDTDAVVTASDNNVFDIISGANSNSQSAPIKLDDEVKLSQPAEKLGEDIVSSEPLTIDAHAVASIVDRDGNGVNDSVDNGGIVDIFKDTAISTPVDVFKETAVSAPVDTTISNNSSLSSKLDFLSSDHFVPTNSFDRNPIESFGSHEYSVPSSSQYSSLFTDTKTDKLPYGDDNIMSDVVRSMSDLMKQNRDQRNTIVQYQERLDSVEAQRRMAIEQYKQTAIRVEALSSKLRTLEESSTRLEARNQMYETRLRDQEKIIASQERELKTLRPQLEGKQDLVKLLADAKALLGSDSDYSTYDDGSNYYRRVA